MKMTDRDVEAYLASLDEALRPDMAKLHELISKHMPGVVPRMWEGAFWGGSEQAIIGYGDMTFTRSDKTTVDWFMVGLTQQKNYISIYISATEDDTYMVKKYGHKLGKAKLGSSSISFKKLADIDVDELTKLIDEAFAQLAKP